MDATSLGLWLAGVGAAGTISLFLTEPPPSSTGGLTFNSPGSAKPLRIRHAVRLVSAVFIGSGSIVVAISQTPPWWLVLATAVGFLAGVWVHAAWTQHHVWREQWEEARRAPEETRTEYPAMQERYDVAKRCSRWSWALMHPFDGETWPKQ